MARTAANKENLRLWAAQQISDRQDVVLKGAESTRGDAEINYETRGDSSGDICQAVIDKKSGKGYVCITDASTGSASEHYRTSPDQAPGYKLIEIKAGQKYMRYGSYAVLYIVRS